MKGKAASERTEREKQLRKQLEQLKAQAAQHGIQVRLEQGNFRSGSCRVEERQQIIINRRLTLEERVIQLQRELERRNVTPVTDGDKPETDD